MTFSLHSMLVSDVWIKSPYKIDTGETVKCGSKHCAAMDTADLVV